MTVHDLIAILRHYAALPDRACPASVLIDAADRLADGELEAPSAHGPANVESWPKRSGDDWIDSAGKVWDVALYSWNQDKMCPSVTKAGVFRSRRGTRRHPQDGPAAVDCQDAAIKLADALLSHTEPQSQDVAFLPEMQHDMQ